jgi:hypothetical protein
VVADGAQRTEWQWTRKEATLAFRNPKRDVVLFIEADNPSTSGNAARQIDVLIGDQALGTVPIERGAPPVVRKIPISGAQLGGADMVELRLVVDKTFVPALESGASSGDTRELGARVFHAFVQGEWHATPGNFRRRRRYPWRCQCRGGEILVFRTGGPCQWRRPGRGDRHSSRFAMAGCGLWPPSSRGPDESPRWWRAAGFRRAWSWLVGRAQAMLAGLLFEPCRFGSRLRVDDGWCTRYRSQSTISHARSAPEPRADAADAATARHAVRIHDPQANIEAGVRHQGPSGPIRTAAGAGATTPARGNPTWGCHPLPKRAASASPPARRPINLLGRLSGVALIVQGRRLGQPPVFV